MNRTQNCAVCCSPLQGRQTKFCSARCKSSHFQTYKIQQERGARKRSALIAEMGGKCTRCGYDKNTAALSFHHTRAKVFDIDSRSCSNRSMEALQKEASKCRLLCLNCHTEVHRPQFNT